MGRRGNLEALWRGKLFFAEGLPQVQSSVFERGIKRQAIYVSKL